MANLYIQEYLKVATDGQGHVVQAGIEPAIKSQKVTFTTSTQSNAFDNSTTFVRLYSDTACYLLFGTNPTAVTASGLPLAANTAEFFAIYPGQSLKVAAVT